MKTLIITDVQHDFLPGGALGIAGADAIIPIINQLLLKFDHVIGTQDWHPPHHVSFASTHKKKVGEVIQIGKLEQILWPDHCLQNSWGAAFSEELKQEKIEAVFQKGVKPEVDSYSTFFDNARSRSTGLSEYLIKRRFNDLYFVGFSTDYCIYYSVLDALDLGFKATVIQDACRAINLHPDDEKKALHTMKKRGAKIIGSKNFFGEYT